MPAWYGGSALNPDETVPRQHQWLYQWSRVARYILRVRTAARRSEREELSSYEIDDIISFFQNCYHLKDWLVSSRPELKTIVDAHFSSSASFEWGACRDICNGYKHKALTRPTHDPDFNIYREYDHFAEPGKSPVRYRAAFADGTDIRKYDLFELAEKCYSLWKDFLILHEDRLDINVAAVE